MGARRNKLSSCKISGQYLEKEKTLQARSRVIASHHYKVVNRCIHKVVLDFAFVFKIQELSINSTNQKIILY